MASFFFVNSIFSAMSSNFGKIFTISTWGESHGAGIGVTIDGCPAGVPLTVEDIQFYLDRRKPGQNTLTTARSEKDKVQILSGVFEGKTTGTPISLAIFNEDQRSGDYSEIQSWYRPGHADLTYDLKYGFRDYRGGGRSSARETAARVAAGSVARKILKSLFATEFLSWVSSVGQFEANIDFDSLTYDLIDASPIRCPDKDASSKMEATIASVKAEKDSIGGTVSLLIRNVPPCLGEPAFDRTEALLAQAMLSIPASKGFEIGSGFQSAKMRGSEHNDIPYFKNGTFHTRTNYAGGTLGGITNGENIYCKIAFKPTATIAKEQETVNKEGVSGTLAAKGRHDPCVAVRAPVIVESMAALVLVDLFLRNRARQNLFEI
jgi:chorismate synthase